MVTIQVASILRNCDKRVSLHLGVALVLPSGKFITVMQRYLALIMMIGVTFIAGCGTQLPMPERTNGAPPAEIPTKHTVAFTGIVPDGWNAANLKPGGSCNFDAVSEKGQYSLKSIVSRSKIFRVVGWVAFSVADGVLPDKIALSLRDKNDRRLFASVTPDHREDVGVFFKNPALSEAGIVSEIDLTDLPLGTYTLEFIFRKGDVSYVCGVSRPVTLIND